jgi:hypothetical protein
VSDAEQCKSSASENEGERDDDCSDFPMKSEISRGEKNHNKWNSGEIRHMDGNLSLISIITVSVCYEFSRTPSESTVNSPRKRHNFRNPTSHDRSRSNRLSPISFF